MQKVLVVAVTAVGLSSMFGVLALRGQDQAVTQLRRDRGQPIAPIYEGWFKAPDGFTYVSFGYLNRNLTEAVDVPIGPNNRIAPGAIDQGQPTHFQPGIEHGVFTVRLPQGSTEEVSWTVSSYGQSYTIPANMKTDYVISPLAGAGPPDLTSAEAPKDNQPPTVAFVAGGDKAQGPVGVRRAVTATVGQALPLEILVADDGIPRPRPGGRGRFARGLTVDWHMHRGPTTVAFADADPPIQNGRAVTSATFPSPGDYVLRVVVDDHGGQGQCCWTNAYVDVHVNAASGR